MKESNQLRECEIEAVGSGGEVGSRVFDENEG